MAHELVFRVFYLFVLEIKAKQARSGEWGQWSEWTNCTRICGGGTRKRHRFCNNPAPSNGGQNCVGNRLEKETCNSDKCPGKPW